MLICLYEGLVKEVANVGNAFNVTKHKSKLLLITLFFIYFQGSFKIQFRGDSWPASIQNVRFNERISNKKAGKQHFGHLYH